MPVWFIINNNMMADDGCVIVDTIYRAPEVAGIATTAVAVDGRAICTAKRQEMNTKYVISHTPRRVYVGSQLCMINILYYYKINQFQVRHNNIII